MIEDLYRFEKAVDQMNIAVTVDADTFWPEKRSHRVTLRTELRAEPSLVVENLDPEIHRVHNENIVPVYNHFSGKVELTWSTATTSEVSEVMTFKVHDKNLVAQGVGNVDLSLALVDGNAGGPLEKAFLGSNGTNVAAELATRVEYEDLAECGIGNVNIVGAIDRDADRRTEWLTMLSGIDTGIFLFLEVENVN